jgi:hypothetical protein
MQSFPNKSEAPNRTAVTHQGPGGVASVRSLTTQELYYTDPFTHPGVARARALRILCVA